MAGCYRQADTGSRHLKIRHIHDFFCFVDHFHFFKCKSIILEHINLRDGIKGNLIMLFVAFDRKDLRLMLFIINDRQNRKQPDT
ncbi:Uncharacterised protein [Mycobacteroides abscessus subsp. abscessus]|nr:Uncharacterised protein [Mycobacteroides abscessus subsp. abscessus]